MATASRRCPNFRPIRRISIRLRPRDSDLDHLSEVSIFDHSVLALFLILGLSLAFTLLHTGFARSALRITLSAQSRSDLDASLRCRGRFPYCDLPEWPYRRRQFHLRGHLARRGILLFCPAAPLVNPHGGPMLSPSPLASRRSPPPEMDGHYAMTPLLPTYSELANPGVDRSRFRLQDQPKWQPQSRTGSPVSKSKGVKQIKRGQSTNPDWNAG